MRSTAPGDGKPFQDDFWGLFGLGWAPTDHSPSVPPWVLAEWVLKTPLKGPIGSEPLLLNPGLLVSDSLAARIAAARSRAPQTAPPSILRRDGETAGTRERPRKTVRWCEHALGEAQSPCGEVSVEWPRGARGGAERWRSAGHRGGAALWWDGSGDAWSEASRGAWGGRAGSWSWGAAWSEPAEAAAEAPRSDGWWSSSSWWEATAGRAEPAPRRSEEWRRAPAASPREPWAGPPAHRGAPKGGEGPRGRCGDVAARGGGRGCGEEAAGDAGARNQAAGWRSHGSGALPDDTGDRSSGRGSGGCAHGACRDKSLLSITRVRPTLEPTTKWPLRGWADEGSKPAGGLQCGDPAEGALADVVYVDFGGQRDALVPARRADRLGIDFHVEICTIDTGRSLVTLKQAAGSRGGGALAPQEQEGGRDGPERRSRGDLPRSPRPWQGPPPPAAARRAGEALEGTAQGRLRPRAGLWSGPGGEGEARGGRLWSSAGGARKSP
ncbi:unnamed protein product [Prorocentrum cordatum]|uniref:Uncharacterized protein n=1 Tax=Prorocentrum cordatum TaxID=2364126 RepID=A0ABN9QB06_9DINO|nr:unnamed protein product [Polarella glacialis]